MNTSRCTCGKWRPDPDCPQHGRPGQLTIEQETNQETEKETDQKYDPETARIPF